MSMYIDYGNKELFFVVPNSEAPIEAQHFGIADKTVGSFYMSERYDDCCSFFNNFDGVFYIDVLVSVANAKRMLELLKSNKLETSFKSGLIAQENAIKALEWCVEQNGTSFYEINHPQINDRKKYLKMDNLDEVYKLVRSFLLGDLSKLVFKRIGCGGYVVYTDSVDDFVEKIIDGTVGKWHK